MRPEKPDPILNKREEEAIIRLNKDYAKFCEPSFVGKSLLSAKNAILKVVPQKVTKVVSQSAEKIADFAPFQEALKIAGKGFEMLTKHATKLTVSKSAVVRGLRKSGLQIDDFDQIPFVRSYVLEKRLQPKVTANLFIAAGQGAATGWPGAVGIPFNLVCSFFLFFRATQSVALSYGYDVKDDPAELAIASEVTLHSLSPSLTQAPGTIGEQLVKIMTISQLAELQRVLVKGVAYETMAKNGGIQLLFLQLRATANQAAKKALEKSGNKGIEAGVFKGLIEKIGSKLSKQFGAKAIPIVGALFGAGIDSYLMHRVLTGANLFYHKRFLVEKAQRIMIYEDEHGEIHGGSNPASDNGNDPGDSDGEGPSDPEDGNSP